MIVDRYEDEVLNAKEMPEPILDDVCQFCDEGEIYKSATLIKAWQAIGFDEASFLSSCKDLISGWKNSSGKVYHSTTCPVCGGTGRIDL
jgi:hypothetical protein